MSSPPKPHQMPALLTDSNHSPDRSLDRRYVEVVVSPREDSLSRQDPMKSSSLIQIEDQRPRHTVPLGSRSNSKESNLECAEVKYDSNHNLHRR